MARHIPKRQPRQVDVTIKASLLRRAALFLLKGGFLRPSKPRGCGRKKL